MRLRIVLLWGLLLVSCVQIKAQEIIAKFNSQPVITLSTKAIRIKFDYSVYHAKNKELKLIINICDDGGNVVLDDLKEFTPTDNELRYTLDTPYFWEELKENNHSTLYLSAVICWSSYEGAGHNWAFIDKIPFSLNVNSPSSSSNSTVYQEKKVCSYCNGTGFVKCSHCDGYGYLEPGFGPRGNGKIGGGNTTCPECRGAKTKECPLKKEYPQLHLGGNRNSYTAHGSQGVSNQNTASTSSSSYSIPSSSTNSFAPPSSSSYSSNTNSKYKALSDPNLVDNSEKIKKHENIIKELEYKKQHCYLCHGTGKTQKNCTMCFLGWSGYGKYKHPCTFCSGTGKVDDYCFECRNTNITISATEHYLKSLKETHGMTKETAAFYYEHKNKMAQMERDYQNSINAIAEPYLNSTRKSNSSNSSTSSSSKCSMCNGTGIDPHAYYSGDPKPAVGGYTHSSGGKCIYCGKYEWHQHVYCPKCNANKYP